MLARAGVRAALSEKRHQREAEHRRGPLHLRVYGTGPEKTDKYGQRHEEYVLHTHLPSRIATGWLSSRLTVAALNVAIDGKYPTRGFQLAQESRELVDASGEQR